MNKTKWIIFNLIFIAGFLSCLLTTLVVSEIEVPLPFGINFSSNSAPGDWISQDDIEVYNDRIVINIEGATIGRYAPTGSMKPILDENSNGIRINPKSAEEIEIGDIITFERDGILIIHRVIDKGIDKEGVYFITKGDNNNVTDGKVRFENIKYITIGVLY